MKIHRLIIIYLLSFGISGCAQNSREVNAFKDTKAYNLAVAVAREDLNEIEKLVKRDSTIMEFANSINGSNVLELSIDIEKYKSFKYLLQLGANPNYINPNTNYSVLINAIQPFGSQFEWRVDNRYVETLLKFGANPNYVVEEDFTNDKDKRILAKSPLYEASGLDLKTVQILLDNGADPNIKVGKSPPFKRALQFNKYDIINYYIDEVKIDVLQPIRIRESDSLFIQDYIVNKYTKAKIFGDTVEMERLKKLNEGIEEANQERWRLIQKLKNMEVDFKNYDYKL
jgi:hypothetical protein